MRERSTLLQIREDEGCCGLTYHFGGRRDLHNITTELVGVDIGLFDVGPLSTKPQRLRLEEQVGELSAWNFGGEDGAVARFDCR